MRAFEPDIAGRGRHRVGTIGMALGRPQHPRVDMVGHVNTACSPSSSSWRTLEAGVCLPGPTPAAWVCVYGYMVHDEAAAARIYKW